ncbi:MAG: hypothetical protein AAB250_19795 [Bdellovibrionota bacterium]
MGGIIFGIFGAFLFAAVHATEPSGDVKVLSQADVAGLVVQAVKSVKDCEGLKGVKRVDTIEIEIKNKTDEHFDKSILNSALEKELKKQLKIAVKPGAEKDPKMLVKAEINSKKTDGAAYRGEYSLKIEFLNEGETTCWSSASLVKESH